VRERTHFLYWASGRVRCISPSLLSMCVRVRESVRICVCACVSVCVCERENIFSVLGIVTSAVYKSFSSFNVCACERVCVYVCVRV